MPKKSGTKKTGASTQEAAPSTDPLEMSVAQPEPTKKSIKTKKSKTKETTTVEQPVVESTNSVAPVETTDVVVDTVTDAEAPNGQELVNSILNEFSATLQSLTSQLSTLRAEFKTLSKTVNREMKVASKSSRRKRTGGNKQPSGFVKPTLITDELATFLGREKGTEMARTEVTKEINQYIRDNKLQDSSNGRHINPDKKLTKLLSYDGNETLTYFNLQKYLSPHFVKPAQESA